MPQLDKFNFLGIIYIMYIIYLFIYLDLNTIYLYQLSINLKSFKKYLVKKFYLSKINYKINNIVLKQS
jgi:hypothetical protein